MKDVSNKKPTNITENFREDFCSNKWRYKNICDNNLLPEVYLFLRDSYELLLLLEKRGEQGKSTIGKTICSRLQYIINNYIKDNVKMQINLSNFERKPLILLLEETKNPTSYSQILCMERIFH